MANYAEIIISATAKELDKSFHYAIPAHLAKLLQIGMRVRVPFGAARDYEGFVVGLADAVDFDPARIKAIDSLMEDFPIFSPHMIALARWMAEKYHTTLAGCLRCIMPAGIGMKNDYIVTIAESSAKGLKGKTRQIFEYLQENGSISQREMQEHFGDKIYTNLSAMQERGLIRINRIYEAKDYTARINMARLIQDAPDFDAIAAKIMEKSDKQAQLLALLMENGQMPVADIRAILHISMSPIKTLQTRGLIRIDRIETRRDLFASRHYDPPTPISPTPDQFNAINALLAKIDKADNRPVLLHGVTGSGKTEVYLQIIEKIIAGGKQAIVLVPEISLTPQAIEVFAQRLGAAVTFTHSRLSLGERYDQWKRARDGQVSVMLGPRSAIFTPFANLGAIIVDEEHENTYKSETSPKYHTVDIAKKLGELTGALVLLGSATPDVATYHAAMDGAYQLISLPQRVNKTQNLVEIADMRRELAEGNRTIFSKALFDAITDNLAANRQSILFLNRRGHSTFVCCRACGHTMACTNCNVNLTFHIYTNKLVCHYCAMQMANPDNCPVCGSRHIKHFGIGTQRVMEDISQFFPSARAIRMDMDTTGRKDSHESIISAFSRGEADILVGTQMIAKGLNFPQVSLVGIMAADMAIHGGDYRSAEVAYQLITQVSGRAGRADLPGRAIIQTYNPDHYAIAHATESDYLRFYAEEIEFRRQMFYPPFSHVVSIICKSPDERGLIALLHRLSDIMHAANRKNLCHILGPAPCIISKIRNQYRWKILAKSADETILRQFALHCLNKLTKSQDTSKININMTMDPKNIP